jgi:hypothetical protein
VLRNRAAKYEAKNIEFAVLARVIRDGGIKVAVIARYSIIPNHRMPLVVRAGQRPDISSQF